MNLSEAVKPRAVAETARQVIDKVRPGTAEGRRSLPVRGEPDALRQLWAGGDARTAVLAGIPVADARLEITREMGDWGTVVTLDLRLEQPLPGTAAQALAGKAVRRFKALAETGEVPTTDHNPSARPDAGEESA